MNIIIILAAYTNEAKIHDHNIEVAVKSGILLNTLCLLTTLTFQVEAFCVVIQCSDVV
jgi:hypothetical protein